MPSTQPLFWEDDRGFVISAEFTMISAVLVLSLVVGMNGLSTTMSEELTTMTNSSNASLPVDRYSTLGLDQQSSSPEATSNSLPGDPAAG